MFHFLIIENWEVGAEVTAQPTNRARVRQRRIESDPDAFQQLLRTQLEKMDIARKLKGNSAIVGVSCHYSEHTQKCSECFTTLFFVRKYYRLRTKEKK